MKRVCERVRCVRRFALFPVKIWDRKTGHTFCVWLEVYYAIQRRGNLYTHDWRNEEFVDKETWEKWRADHDKTEL